MDPLLSMNTMSGYVDLRELEARTKVSAAQRTSLALTFHPKDGSAPLRAWALKEAGDGWWDIIVDNTTVESGTPHRIFETRSRMIGPLDTDPRGLFSVSAPQTTPTADFGTGLHPSPAHFEKVQAAVASVRDAMGGSVGAAHARVPTLMTAQMHAPGKMFSRETIVGVLRGRRADAEMDCPGSPRSNELAYLIRIFENLE